MGIYKHIVVNGWTKAIDAGVATLSYESLRDMAGKTGSPSMTWRIPLGRGGCLAPGETIDVTDGLVINCVHTNNA